MGSSTEIGYRAGSVVRTMMEAPISASLANLLAATALEKRALDLVILDMQELVDYTDIFVICSARNRRQVRAIADGIRSVAKADLGLYAKGVEGLDAGRWVLVDFGDVVVHIFDEALRGFYDLDGLWADAPRLPVPEVTAEIEGEAESLFQI